MNLGSIILTICSSHYYLIWDFTFTYIPKNISLGVGGGGGKRDSSSSPPPCFLQVVFFDEYDIS